MTLTLLVLLHFLFSYKRLLRLLRSFQQEDYLNQRFIRWWWQRGAFDKRGSCAALLGALHPYLGLSALAVVAFREPNARREGKVTLKMTARMQRITLVSFGLVTLLSVPALLHPYRFWALPLVYQLMPFCPPLAALLLSPDEERRQAKFRSEAKARLHQVAPTVIGITGSFGKTSTKNMLGELLNVALGPTFWPQAGVNTEMGITREIRERLKPKTEFAVVEMGAYGKGSIARLCRFTPPQAGIITAVAHCHLERFKSRDGIRRAKAELAEAIPDDGILVVNGDDDFARRIAHDNPKKHTYFFGSQDPDLDCRLVNYQVKKEGTEFVLDWKGTLFHGFVPLWGRPALFNLMASFTMAAALGADPHLLIGALRNLQPVRNRLELKSHNGITTLHDAYNSNPTGFRDALDVLQSLPAERRILMTPGMIELGDDQQTENQSLGRKAGEICHKVLVVGETNRKALTEGLREAGLSKDQILELPDRDSALKEWLKMQQEGDALLIENDLTDLYEQKELF